MAERQQRDPSASASPGRAPAAPGPEASRGQALKRGAAEQGVDAQEALLSPASGLLEPAEVDAALKYNNAHNKRGKAWVQALQGFLGVGASGAYDEPTVQGVAGFQSDKALKVDGKVGANTTAQLDGAGVDGQPGFAGPSMGVEAPSAKDPAKEGAPDGGKAAAGPGGETAALGDGATASAPIGGKAPAPTPIVATPTQAEEGADAAPTMSVRDVLKALDAVPGPGLTFGEGSVLDISAIADWASKAAPAFEAAARTLAQIGPERAAERTKLEGYLNRRSKAIQMAGSALRDRSIQLVNDSTLMKSPTEQPTLPPRAQLLGLGADMRRIGACGALLAIAAHECQDAVLATQQGMSVLAARATLKERPQEAKGDAAIEAQEKRGDGDALNRIFRDSGYDNRINVEGDAGHKRIADWCGIFCASSMFRGGGIDEELRGGFFHTSNVEDYFKYTGSSSRTPRSIWADGKWHKLEDYHGARGSLRTWQTRGAITTVMEGDGALDVRPGDIALIDHSGKGKAAQHITMVESYDPATMQLTTIEGNTGGVIPDSNGDIDQLGDGYVKQNARTADTSALNTRDMSNMSKASAAAHADVHDANMARDKAAPKGAYRGRGGMTVFGIGRPSAVDFEEHEYATEIVPTKYAHMSPAEMSQKANAGAKKAVDLRAAK